MLSPSNYSNLYTAPYAFSTVVIDDARDLLQPLHEFAR